MMDEPPDALSPGEERLLTLLVLLREDAPQPDDVLTDRIMRQARRQHVLRQAVAALATILAGIIDGALLLLGLRRGPAPAPAR